MISFAFALAWLVAVVKVFLLESHPNFTNTSPDVSEHIKSVNSKSSHRVHVHHHINITSKSLHNVGKKHVIKIGNATVKAADLKWPPVNLDGSIPSNEGFDVMPLTKLKVPRFWSPPEGADVFKTGSKINNEETIFFMIASYRDFQCRETITSAFSRADHPERLFVGAVDQVVPGDVGCLDIDIPCTVNPEQPICKYRNQISIFKMDAQYATGPVTARHIGDRMYRGEYFVMQMDAHCMFIRHWDTKIIT